jgi:hypothetical protein
MSCCCTPCGTAKGDGTGRCGDASICITIENVRGFTNGSFLLTPFTSTSGGCSYLWSGSGSLSILLNIRTDSDDPFFGASYIDFQSPGTYAYARYGVLRKPDGVTWYPAQTGEWRHIVLFDGEAQETNATITFE